MTTWQDIRQWPVVLKAGPDVDVQLELLKEAKDILLDITEYDSGPIDWRRVRDLAERIHETLDLENEE